MSNLVVTWVFTNSDATLSDRLVLIAIADEADDDGFSFPSQRRTAEKARLAVNTTRAAIDRLESAGELVVDRPDRQGRGHFCRYVVLMGRDVETAITDVGRKWKGSNLEHLPNARERAGTRGNARPKADTAPLPHTPLDPLDQETRAAHQDSEPNDAREIELGAARAPGVSARSQGDAPDKKPTRRRNPVWDGLAAVFGDPAPSERSFFGRVVRELAQNPDATEEEVRVRARRAQQRFTSPSVQAVAKHWTALGQEQGRRRVANDAPEWDETDGPVQVREWDG